ncbi:hypothetical protein QNH08_gp54 [Aeromonas phage pAh6.2TG]|uniref:Uncharacterized protein n=2 Tax=Phayathaivirus TaxID=3153015 RepID=A0A8F3C9A8_9CAUD|nr:hypothetical protein QNH08_gp54 [Aeromonas phage pAh6.2TG]YP_010845332.1 hypothetical protein QNH09_gp50 [Aeromonas phage PVN03]QLI47651.1 hypothetical protein [Aeromonas phage PVN02]QTQ06897.1 hypothetical protein [Aeromonas phage PVN04]QTQ06963.1 hypothetical protein [Aeromonas phage PVN05]QTQ06832.1 hypothetical protein [Aeromonas phage PVN03]QWY14086.1 hypothetical protein [Aeromonas phage pAh6.2TG]
MSLKTRLDQRSEGNNRFLIVDSVTGEVVARISAVSSKVEVEIETAPGLHIEKPNGFSSKR